MVATDSISRPSQAPRLPRRLNEAGKIRIGHQIPVPPTNRQGKPNKRAGEPMPAPLEHFRLTSSSRAALEAAARLYGGEVRPWIIRQEWKNLPQMRPPDHRFELYTTSDTLHVVIRAESLMDTQYEQWDGAYCTRRCNGAFISFDGYGKLQGMECQCEPDLTVRKDLAKDGRACLGISRICVMLEGLPLGQWRLDTRGEFGPMDVRGLQDLLEGCHLSTALLRATMRLEARTSHVMVQGEKLTHHYSLVVIEPGYTPEALLIESARAQQRQLTAADEHTKTADEHIADMWGDDQRGSLPQAIPAIDVEAGEVIECEEAQESTEQRLDDPDANQGHSSATASAEASLPCAWRDTLEAYRDDVRLSDGLRSRAKLALNPASNTSDAKGLALASAVLDTLNAQEP